MPQNNRGSISDLFTREPEQWGLRGDPFLWGEMRKAFEGVPIPDTEQQFTALMGEAFERLVGDAMDHAAPVYIARYAQGGMSSGYIDPGYWREKLLKLLLSRYRKWIVKNRAE